MGYESRRFRSSLTGRVPISISKNNHYFQDRYHGIPSEGITNYFKECYLNQRSNYCLNKEFLKIKMLLYIFY